ncbi:trypsin-like serine peptidase [Acidihalobacter prosperus]|uniref:trypsin-like serine peptidase n=1 Tax=Acidihalobacter prosperus TaxID=160660 RepID=UPI00191C0169|nr:trypsin-like peptidase domain-containing protein [Acidihalobacter prosperus]
MSTDPSTIPPDMIPAQGSALTMGLEIPSLKSLYIEMYFKDVLLSSGTAFLVANDQSSHCALITNRHNVTGRHQETGECLDKKHGAIPDTIRIYFHKPPLERGEWHCVSLPLYKEDDSPWWIEHPRLGASADVVALNLKWGSDVQKLPYYLKTDLDRQKLVVRPAEPISVIGFPFGLSSTGHFPIWATGFMAQELGIVTPDNQTFLIDCRTRQGQSGSPVIAYRTNVFTYLNDNGRISTTMAAGVAKWEFLGIYSGRVNSESDLGRVWHVSAIEEVLAAAETAMPAPANPI